MEKKLYIKPGTEILDMYLEDVVLAGSPSYSGNEDEIDLGTPTTPDPDKPISF